MLLQCHHRAADDVARLSARVNKLEPLVARVEEVEQALLAHAKSNRDRFEVSESNCRGHTNDRSGCMSCQPRPRIGPANWSSMSLEQGCICSCKPYYYAAKLQKLLL